MSSITLRDYQEEAVQAAIDARERGAKKVLGVAATGLGKTIVFSALAERLGIPTLILAHRDELITQAADKLLSVWPEADVGIVKAKQNEINRQTVVASVQTLHKRRLDKIPQDRFNGGLIITDEAHHGSATSYQNIYEHFGCGTPDGPFHVGVTATPDRGDGKGLDKTFDEIIFSYDILWGIRAGYLSDLKGLRIYLKNANFKDARVRQGDYHAGDVGQILEDANAPELIVEAWLKHASERKTLVFTPTVETAHLTADAFIANGINAEVVSAGTPLEERRDMLKRFASGELRIICNCGVLTEGFDDPEVSCIVVARPTRSRALYTQIVGRGSRRHPDKTDCLIMDVVGASDDNSLVCIPSLFGVQNEKEFEEGEKGIAEIIFEEEAERVRKGEMQAKAIDLFKKVLDSPISWTHFTSRSGLKTYACGVLSPDKTRSTIVIEHLGGDEDLKQWHCYVRWNKAEEVPEGTPTQAFPNGDRYRSLISRVDLEMAQGVGEDYIRKNAIPATVSKTAAWRGRPPTEKQLDAAAKWKMPVDPSWTAGEFSEAFTRFVEAKKHANKSRKPTPTWVSDKPRDRW